MKIKREGEEVKTSYNYIENFSTVLRGMFRRVFTTILKIKAA